MLLLFLAGNRGRAGEEAHGVKVGLVLGRACFAWTVALHLHPLNAMRKGEYASEKELVVICVLVRAWWRGGVY